MRHFTKRVNRKNHLMRIFCYALTLPLCSHRLTIDALHSKISRTHTVIILIHICYIGMVGMMGVAAVTKKRGGYTNTKLHGIMAWVGMILAGSGLYVIYQNKENMGKSHFTTYHSWGEGYRCLC